MEAHFLLSDTEFEQQFETCRLNPEIFSHEAHLRLAWVHICQYGKIKALENICSQLVNYVDFLGARHKYNHTLTIAAIKAVYHFIQKSNADNFKDFILEFPQLKHNFKGLMSVHYQEDIFASEKAKNTYLEPDLAPFD